MSTVTTDPRGMIADAIGYLRKARHHLDCRCFNYRDLDHVGWCSPQEAMWNKAVDKLIDDIRNERR